MRTPHIGHPVSRIRVDRSKRTPVTPELLTHLRFLGSIGMNRYMIARSAGVVPDTIRQIQSGVSATCAAAIYDALMGVTPRPSQHQASVLPFATHRRLEGLSVMGWTSTAIAEQVGVHLTSIRGVRTRSVITWSSHVAVREVYDRLSHIDGGNARTKAWAVRQGFVAPLMWDDIDNFYETPTAPADSDAVDEVVVRRIIDGILVTDATQAEREAALAVLIRRGEFSNVAMARQTGFCPRTVERHRAMAS